MRTELVLLLLPVPFYAGCGKRADAVAVGAAASSLAASTASGAAPGSVIWHCTVDPKSTSHIDMPGLSEHIVADTNGAAGDLDVVPGDLGQSRGLVRIDLATLTTSTFHTEKDVDQTTHARTWLEAVVEGKTNETMRWAEFAIRSVDGLSAADLAKVVPASDAGNEVVRRVRAVVHGDLLVHGHRVPKDDAVEVTFRYAPGAAADARPARIEIRSEAPMRVVLKEHEVEPRDPVGKVLGWTTRLVSKVAETADVTVDIVAVCPS